MGGYQPSRNEEFMNDSQRGYFRDQLMKLRQTAVVEARDMQEIDQNVVADVLDAAVDEARRNATFAARQRTIMLLNRIDQALRKLEEGTYGYCEETGEPIAVERLMARPIASLSIDAQERLEKMKKHGKMMVF